MNGEDIRQWRRRNGYQRQADLQKELEVKSRATISNWENTKEEVPRVLELALTALEEIPSLRNIWGQRRGKGTQTASSQEVNRRHNPEPDVDFSAEINAASEKISSITQAIEHTAFQTYLLALDAGVEAARAANVDRGFAVVAAEVRDLAQRSSEACRQIQNLVAASTDEISNNTTDVIAERLGTLTSESVSKTQEIASAISAISQALNASALSNEAPKCPPEGDGFLPPKRTSDVA